MYMAEKMRKTEMSGWNIVNEYSGSSACCEKEFECFGLKTGGIHRGLADRGLGHVLQ